MDSACTTRSAGSNASCPERAMDRPRSPATAEEYRRLPLRAHSLLAGVPLQDAWRVDLPGGGDARTMEDVRSVVESARKSQPLNPPVRALFASLVVGASLPMGRSYTRTGGVVVSIAAHGVGSRAVDDRARNTRWSVRGPLRAPDGGGERDSECDGASVPGLGARADRAGVRTVMGDPRASGQRVD